MPIKNYVGIIDEKMGWNEHAKKNGHFTFAFMSDGVPTYLPVAYSGDEYAGKVYDISKEGGPKVTIYVENFDLLCENTSVKKINVGQGLSEEERGMLEGPTFISVYPDLAKMLRLDIHARTVQHVTLEEWQVGMDVPVLSAARRTDPIATSPYETNKNIR